MSNLVVLTVSPTSFAGRVAHTLWNASCHHGVKCEVKVLGSVDYKELFAQENNVVLIMPSTPKGKLPDEAATLVAYLDSEPSLSSFITMIALGDTSFPGCSGKPGRQLLKRMLDNGAKVLLEELELDAMDSKGNDAVLASWILQLWQLKDRFVVNEKLPPTLTVNRLENLEVESVPVGYSHLKLIEKKQLDSEEGKEILHIELERGDIGSFIPGDLLEILPCNDPKDVEMFLEAMKLDPKETVQLEHASDVGCGLLPTCPVTLRTLFTQYLDIRARPGPTVFSRLASLTSDKVEKITLENLAGVDIKGLRLREELFVQHPGFAGVLLKHASLGPSLSLLLELIPPLEPRCYSIASPPSLKALHLCVQVVQWTSQEGKKHFGTASCFLSKCVPGAIVSARLKRGVLSIPEAIANDCSVVLACQATAIAPFRSLLLERKASGVKGKAILFFGMQKSNNYLYKDELESLEKEGLLSLNPAFSRDHLTKVYIQDLMLQQAESVGNVLRDGGYLLYCGMSGPAESSFLDAAASTIGSKEALLQFPRLRVESRPLCPNRGGGCRRINWHPVLPSFTFSKKVAFTCDGIECVGYEGEALSSALIANGIDVFSYSKRDNAPQGLFCANGQCGQCTLMVNGIAMKSCMVNLRDGMVIERRPPTLPVADDPAAVKDPTIVETDVLVLGGGPAGMCAATELGKRGAKVLLIDDKDRLGGKLVLQTHKFFGTIQDCYAGTRGIKVAEILTEDLRACKTVDIWLNSIAVAVFSDKMVGVVKENKYFLIKPRVLMVTLGAREQVLTFPGNAIPGVIGAGAFQTLINRDLVKCSKKVLIVGGGNVGVIAGYHAIQAGIEVVGLVEALPKVGAYKVHADKLARLGVPLMTSHTVVSAHGRENLKSVIVAECGSDFKPVPGTEKKYEVDTLLIAVGLSPCDEFVRKGKQYGMTVFDAGDTQEIAEASAAMLTGRVEGVKIAKHLGLTDESPSADWVNKAAIMRSRPGRTLERSDSIEEGVHPVISCFQEIPCNACTGVCPHKSINISGDDIRSLPAFDHKCTGCFSCVAVCPGLAITVVDYRKNKENPLVTLPCELVGVTKGDLVGITDKDGNLIGRFPVVSVRSLPKFGTSVVQVNLPRDVARKAVGVGVQPFITGSDTTELSSDVPDDSIVCRCERLTAGEVRALIREGVRDINELKARLRIGMGPCQSKVCGLLLPRIFRQEGVQLPDVTKNHERPLFMEVPLGAFAGVELDW